MSKYIKVEMIKAEDGEYYPFNEVMKCEDGIYRTLIVRDDEDDFFIIDGKETRYELRIRTWESRSFKYVKNPTIDDVIREPQRHYYKCKMCLNATLSNGGCPKLLRAFCSDCETKINFEVKKYTLKIN
jgi:hypothetical protein